MWNFIIKSIFKIGLLILDQRAQKGWGLCGSQSNSSTPDFSTSLGVPGSWLGAWFNTARSMNYSDTWIKWLGAAQVAYQQRSTCHTKYGGKLRAESHVLSSLPPNLFFIYVISINPQENEDGGCCREGRCRCRSPRFRFCFSQIVHSTARSATSEQSALRASDSGHRDNPEFLVLRWNKPATPGKMEQKQTVLQMRVLWLKESPVD